MIPDSIALTITPQGHPPKNIEELDAWKNQSIMLGYTTSTPLSSVLQPGELGLEKESTTSL